MKTILVILDGLGDKPIKELDNKTPLEAAKKPSLDFLAKNGKTGLIYPIKKGIAPESDTGVLAILGYDPDKYFSGRGPLEAYGMNLNIKNSLVLRTNFATIKGNKIIDRRAGRNLTTKEAKILANAINKKVKLPFKFLFKPSIQHRGVLIIKHKLSTNISNIDPAYKKLKTYSIVKYSSNKLEKCKPLDNKKLSKLTANIINSFTIQSDLILSKHSINKARIKKGFAPANIVLTRDAGNKLTKLPKRKGKWLAIVNMPLEVGIAKLAGMHIIKSETSEIKSKNSYHSIYSNLNKHINNSLISLEKYWNKYNNFYIHIKETDIPGHDGLFKEKKKIIESIDKKFFSKIKNIKNTIIIVTADHSTSCKLKSHSSDPVPVLIYGKDKDSVNNFSEKSCKKGSIKTIYGKNLMNTLSN